MMCREMTEERLNDYVDGTLPAPERWAVELHLVGCGGCREEVERLRALLVDAARLPKSLAPPRDLWLDIERRIGAVVSVRLSARPTARRLALAAAAVLTLLLAHGSDVPSRQAAWEVARVAGTPRIGPAPLGRKGSLRVGDWLETDDSSQARIVVGEIGHVEVKPGTRVRLLEALPAEHRLALARGAIYASVDAPPRVFFVETPSGVAVDLGCAYTMEVDAGGRTLIHVTAGYVEFQGHGRKSIVPLGAYAVSRPVSGPGVPYVEDAPEALRRALAAFDFEDGRAAAVRSALAAARAEDALSLWHVLSRVDRELRPRVYDRLAGLVPPPDGVSRQAVLALEEQALASYWNKIRRIAWRKALLEGIRQIDPRTGLAK